MKKSLFAGATLTALFSGHALANEPLTLVLDWYINPDHAPIMVAEQIGAFKAQGLDVRIIPPSDPARLWLIPHPRRGRRVPRQDQRPGIRR